MFVCFSAAICRDAKSLTERKIFGESAQLVERVLMHVSFLSFLHQTLSQGQKVHVNNKTTVDGFRLPAIQFTYIFLSNKNGKPAKNTMLLLHRFKYITFETDFHCAISGIISVYGYLLLVAKHAGLVGKNQNQCCTIFHGLWSIKIQRKS